MKTPPKVLKALQPLTPLGQDLPEDTPSKIRARSAKECARIRKLLELERLTADLESGLDAHAQVMVDRARKADVVKADAALRRECFARHAVDKDQERQLEALRERRENETQANERQAATALKEALRLERISEERQQRQSTLETMRKVKQTIAEQEAHERVLAAEAYEAGLASMRCKEAEEKTLKMKYIQRRKEGMLEDRARRAKERAAALEEMRQKAEASKKAALEREAEQCKAAEEHRRLLRARASEYRRRKQVAKTAAYTR